MLTVCEAAAILKVTPRRVHDFIADGRLRCVRKSPRLFLLRPRDVDRFSQLPRFSGAAGHKKKRRRVDKCSCASTVGPSVASDRSRVRKRKSGYGSVSGTRGNLLAASNTVRVIPEA